MIRPTILALCLAFQTSVSVAGDGVIAFSVPGQFMSVNTIIDAKIETNSGETAIYLRLPEEVHKALADLTERNIGAKMSVSVCGKELVQPVIRERIANGALAISGVDSEDAERYVEQLHRGRCD